MSEVTDAELSSDVDPSLESNRMQDKISEKTGEETPENRRLVPVSIRARYMTASIASPVVLGLLMSKTEALPRLPNIALNLLPLLSCPGVGTRQVSEIVEKDQATAAKLLRWVNSSLFGLEGKVESLHRAVTLLGLDAVRSIVLEDALGRTIAPSAVPGISTRTIWRHAAAASVASKFLAGSVRGQVPDVAATAGLLHDIGLLLLITVENKKLEAAIAAARATSEPLIAHEDSVIGFNHQVWGEVFVRLWRLPSTIAFSIGSHHSPLIESFDPLAGILWLADFLVSCIGFPCPDDMIPQAPEEEIEELMGMVGLRPPLKRYITENLVRELVKATQYWPMEKGPSAGICSVS